MCWTRSPPRSASTTRSAGTCSAWPAPPAGRCPPGWTTVRSGCRESTRRLLRVLDTPAVVLGRHLDLLAWNPWAVALLGDPAGYPPDRLNMLLLMFDEAATGARRCAAWERQAMDYIGMMRAAVATDPTHPARHRDRRRAEHPQRRVPAAVGPARRARVGQRHQDLPGPRGRRHRPGLGHLSAARQSRPGHAGLHRRAGQRRRGPAATPGGVARDPLDQGALLPPEASDASGRVIGDAVRRSADERRSRTTRSVRIRSPARRPRS